MTATPPPDADDQPGRGQPGPGAPGQGQPHQGPPAWGQPNQPGDGRPYYGQQPGWGSPGQPGGPGGPGAQYPSYQPPQPMRPEDQRLWATLVHIGGIVFNFIAPLVGYLVLRDRGQFVREHTRVALNFHITMAIAYAVGAITAFIGIGVLIVLAVGVVTIVFGVMAAVAANAGRFYRYPLSIEFIKH